MPEDHLLRARRQAATRLRSPANPSGQDIARLSELLTASTVQEIRRVVDHRGTPPAASNPSAGRLAATLAVTALFVSAGIAWREAHAGEGCRESLIRTESELTAFAIQAMKAGRPGPTASGTAVTVVATAEVRAQVEQVVARGTSAVGQFKGATPVQDNPASAAWDALPAGSGPEAWSGPLTVLASAVSRTAGTDGPTCDRISSYQRQGARDLVVAANSAAVQITASTGHRPR